MVTVNVADPRTPAIADLIAQLDRWQLSLYPEASNHLVPVSELAELAERGERNERGAYFVAAREGQAVLGCGAVTYHRDPQEHGAYGEIKRVFVRADARRRGVSRIVMAALEENARQRKVRRMRLETGVRQPEAIELYTSLGYRRRAPFGDYPDDPLSVFMEKTLFLRTVGSAGSVGTARTAGNPFRDLSPRNPNRSKAK